MDNSAALEIEKCFVSIDKSLMQGIEEMFKKYSTLPTFFFFTSQVTVQEFHTSWVFSCCFFFFFRSGSLALWVITINLTEWTNSCVVASHMTFLLIAVWLFLPIMNGRLICKLPFLSSYQKNTGLWSRVTLSPLSPGYECL